LQRYVPSEFKVFPKKLFLPPSPWWAYARVWTKCFKQQSYVNMCPSLVEIHSDLRLGVEKTRKKKERKNHGGKYKPFGIAMLCGLIMTTKLSSNR